MSSKFIVFNWKSNPQTLTKALKLAELADHKNVVVCPPFVYLSKVKEKLLNADLGAQDVFWKEGGSYTGQISPLMLKNIGVKYVIVGHSEKRRLGDTNEFINKKINNSLKTKLKIILCIGEQLRRGNNKKRQLEKAKNFVKNQLLASLRNVSLTKKDEEKLIIAYEPVWAISANKDAKPDNPQDSSQIISFIKKVIFSAFGLKLKVLYGGSVTSGNIWNFLKYNEIDGALVGSASLKENEVKKIIKLLSKK